MRSILVLFVVAPVAVALLWRYRHRADPTSASGHRLSGLIVDPRDGGTPIRGAQIVLIGSDGGQFESETDADGRYDLALLPDDDFEVILRTPGAAAETRFGPFRTVGSPTELRLDQELRRQAQELRGRVVSEQTGLPLVGVRVRLAGSRAPPAVTDADGDFRLAELPAGVQHIELLQDGYPPEVQLVDVASERVQNHVFSLTETLIEATGLLLEADGRPLADTVVTFRSSAGVPMREAQVTSDAAGALSVRLPPGVWYAHDSGREVGLLSLLDATAPAPPFVLRASSPGSEVCLVLSSTGAPAIGARVRWRAHRRTLFEGVTNRRGVAQRDVSQVGRLLALIYGGATAPDPPSAFELEAAWRGEVGRAAVGGGRPCVLTLRPAIEVTLRAPGDTLAWARVPTGLGEQSTLIWFSGSTRVPLPAGTYDFQFGSVRGISNRRLTLSGPTTIEP